MSRCATKTLLWRTALVVAVCGIVYWIVLSVQAWKTAIGGDDDTCATYPCSKQPVNGLSPGNLTTASSHYDAKTARFGADLIVRQLQGVPVEQLTPDGWDLKALLDAHTGQPVGAVYAMHTDPTILMVALRGTEHLKEFILDLSTNQDLFAPFHMLVTVFPRLDTIFAPWRMWQRRKHRPVRVPQLLESQPTAVQHSSGIRVHRGFYELYQRIRDQLTPYLATAQTVVFVGHSMGGALANIAALDTALNLPLVKDVRVYTFGAPRTGNVEFANALDQAPVLTQFFEMQNTSDVIPTLPFSVMPNTADPNHPHYYEHGGTPLAYNLNWGSFTNNHVLPNYIYALDQGLVKAGV